MGGGIKLHFSYLLICSLIRHQKLSQLFRLTATFTEWKCVDVHHRWQCLCRDQQLACSEHYYQAMLPLHSLSSCHSSPAWCACLQIKNTTTSWYQSGCVEEMSPRARIHRISKLYNLIPGSCKAYQVLCFLSPHNNQTLLNSSEGG